MRCFAQSDWLFLIGPEEPAQLLNSPLCLPVWLWMIPQRETDIDLQSWKQHVPCVWRKLWSIEKVFSSRLKWRKTWVRSDSAVWNTVGTFRRDMNRQDYDNRSTTTMTAVWPSEGGRSVHHDVWPGSFWHRQCMELAYGQLSWRGRSHHTWFYICLHFGGHGGPPVPCGKDLEATPDTRVSWCWCGMNPDNKTAPERLGYKTVARRTCCGNGTSDSSLNLLMEAPCDWC